MTFGSGSGFVLVLLGWVGCCKRFWAATDLLSKKAQHLVSNGLPSSLDESTLTH